MKFITKERNKKQVFPIFFSPSSAKLKCVLCVILVCVIFTLYVMNETDSPQHKLVSPRTTRTNVNSLLLYPN